MALINHIDSDDYTQEWKRALGHYFKIVRTYNPMNISLKQHISILESMAQLKEEWTEPVKESIFFFQRYYQEMLQQSADTIATAVYEAVSKVEKWNFKTEEASKEEKEALEARYKERLRTLEYRTQKQIEKIWNHDNLETEQEQLMFEGMDLFSEESASVFGLTRTELLVTGATSGAITGAGIDLMFAGHTFFVGGALGALAGGVGAYFAFNELSSVKVLGQTLGSKYLEIGPMENRNFPYILLGRLVYHAEQIAKRSHAKRGVVDMEMDQSFKERWLDDVLRKSLEKCHKKFRSGKALDPKVMNAYEVLIEGVLQKLLKV